MPDVISHYDLLEKIGSGGMGAVYRVEDQQTGGIFALKTLLPELAADPQYVRRFEAEGRMAQSIDSPNVVKVLHTGHEGDKYFLVMEYVAGRSLSDFLQQHGQLTLDQTLSFTAGIARALVATGASGFVHQDVSPGNVLVTEGGMVKLIDFGLAHDLLGTVDPGSSVQMGNPLYMAPELAAGATIADQRADVYSLGVIIFQMLVGRLPYNAATPSEILQQLLRQPPPSIKSLRPDVPLWLVQLTERCLAKDPSERFSSAQAVLDAHEALLEKDTVRYRPALQLQIRRQSDGLHGTAARFSLLLTNSSDKVLALQIKPNDSEQALKFDLPDSCRVASHSDESIGFSVKTKKKRLFGRPASHSFTIAANTSGAGGTLIVPVTGSFIESPPTWPLVAGLAAMLFLVIAGLVTIFLIAPQSKSPEIVVKPKESPVATSTAPPTRPPATPTPALPVFVASWVEPRTNDVLSTGQVLLRASYGIGSDRRPISRVDFNVAQGSSSRRVCSAFGPTGAAEPSSSAQFSPFYTYECTADLSSGPFGPISFSFDLYYTDGTAVLRAASELRVTRQALTGIFMVNRVIDRSTGFEITLTTVEARVDNTVRIELRYRNLNSTPLNLVCDRSGPDSYLFQGPLRGNVTDEWCRSRLGTTTTIPAGGITIDWAVFNRNGIELGKPFSLNYGTQTVDNISLR